MLEVPMAVCMHYCKLLNLASTMLRNTWAHGRKKHYWNNCKEQISSSSNGT